MSTPIKNVVLLGATGRVGAAVLQKLIHSGNFTVTVLRRAGSQFSTPTGTRVLDIDLTSAEEITAALHGQDAVVSTLSAAAAAAQGPLIEAAAAPGSSVRRFIPTEFGSDLANPHTRKLPVFGHKVAIEDKLVEAAKANRKLTYTFIYTSAFLDMCLQTDVLLKTSDSKPVFYDDGKVRFSTTTIETVADAIVGVLSRPEETANRAVYVHDLVTTQYRLLELAKQVAPERPWAKPQMVAIDDIVARSEERLRKGIFDQETVMPYLFRAMLSPGYGGHFEKTDNELLGLKYKSEDDIISILKKLLK